MGRIILNAVTRWLLATVLYHTQTTQILYGDNISDVVKYPSVSRASWVIEPDAL
jgi:hypothetical protein